MARILIVDGDERFRLACEQELRLDGHEVLGAGTGFDALALVDRPTPDVLIAEVQLPGMDGLDLMSRVLAKDRGVIVILNSSSTCYKDNFLSWAADACLTKSGDLFELRRIVRERLEARRFRERAGPRKERTSHERAEGDPRADRPLGDFASRDRAGRDVRQGLPRESAAGVRG